MIKLVGFPALLLALISQSAIAVPVPLVFSAGSQADFAAATQCIFGGSGVGGCPILTGSSGSAPTATPAGAPGATYVGDSWTYTVSDLMTALGGDNLFNIVIDSNWAQGPDDLDLFQVYVNGINEFEYSVAGTAMNAGANGTGNENWLLSTIDLSGFQSTDNVYFHLEMSGLTDGFEQFALSRAGFTNPCMTNSTLPGCSTQTAEPGVLLLLGAGLLSLAVGRRWIFR